MLEIERLKNFVIKNNIIKEFSDFDFLFESYEYDQEKPLEDLINDVIEWSYNNDKLEVFYFEYWEDLIDFDCLHCIQECIIKDQFALTWFYLYRYNSKNKYYYIIKSEGEFADLIDTSEYVEVLNKQDDDYVIQKFKMLCEDVFDEDGNLSNEDLKSSSISFY